MTRPVRRKARPVPPLDRLARDLAGSAGRGKAPPSGAPAPRVVPGQLRPIPDLERGRAERLFQSALVRVCGGDPRVAARGILWRDAGNEIVLHPARATLATGERLIVVAIPVYTDQTGDALVAIPFVTNAGDSALGLIAATETTPRGPAAVVDVFGDTLVAVAWAALVETAAAWAGAAGDAAGHGRLAPAGLSATKAALLVTAQGRFEPEDR